MYAKFITRALLSFNMLFTDGVQPACIVVFSNSAKGFLPGISFSLLGHQNICVLVLYFKRICFIRHSRQVK